MFVTKTDGSFVRRASELSYIRTLCDVSKQLSVEKFFEIFFELLPIHAWRTEETLLDVSLPLLANLSSSVICAFSQAHLYFRVDIALTSLWSSQLRAKHYTFFYQSVGPKHMTPFVVLLFSC